MGGGRQLVFRDHQLCAANELYLDEPGPQRIMRSGRGLDVGFRSTDRPPPSL